MRRSVTSVAVVAFAVVLSACGTFESSAAVVNGRGIDEEEFRRSLDFLTADPRFAEQFPGQQGVQQRKTFGRQLLAFLVQQQLVREFAGERGITVGAAEVERSLEGQIEAQGGARAFRRQLEAAGVTRGVPEGLIRDQILRGKVARAVVADEVPEETLRAEYESRAIELTRVHVAHILVSTEAEAERIRGQATPANFARLAREFSGDPGSAERGGDLGPRPASEFIGPFAEAAVEIPVGEIGGPVQTEFGFHVIHVLERARQPFEAVRDQLLGELGGEAFNRWLMGRLQAADVRVNPRYGTLDERSGEVVERRSTTPEPAAT